MNDIVTIVFPVFGLIALGYAAARLGLVRDSAFDGVADYVFVAALPALLFRTVVSAAPPAASPWFYWIAFFTGVAVSWALVSFGAGFGARKDYKESVIIGFAAAQANTVMVGVPLILAVFGPAGELPIVLLLAVHLPINMLVASILLEGGDSGTPLLRRMQGLALALVRHPILIGIALGLVIRSTGMGVPKPLMGIVDAVAGTATACALFAMGGSLKRYGFAGNVPLASFATFAKLVVHPAVVWGMAWALSLDPVWTGVAVLFAAAPSGVNTYLLAARYNLGLGVTSSTIALSTALAALSVPVWLILIGR